MKKFLIYTKVLVVILLMSSCEDYLDVNTDPNNPDTDGDGIEDRWDQCIFEPETWNDYLDWDGCPDEPGAESTTPVYADTDQDGYVDVLDSCPTSPETWNKYLDDDGCPDIVPEQQRFVHDDDLDGIINDEDSCPLDPEDYDGDRDDDGCPDQ